MNKRQAKKQYKKIHGHNPPKTAVAVYTPEEIESMKIYNNLTPEDIERIANNLRSAAAEMFKALQRVAESIEQMEREWENYLKKNRAKMVKNLMKEQQRHFSTSIGEKHTVEEWGKALEEFAEYQCQQDKEERTWQDHIMDRFMRKI